MHHDKKCFKVTNKEAKAQLSIPLTLRQRLLRSKGNQVCDVWQKNGMKEEFQPSVQTVP